MNRLFFDTWGWIAIAHRQDRHHIRALEFYREFIGGGGMPVTTDYVLSETITLLRSRTSAGGTERFMDPILSAAKSGRIVIEHVSQERWLRAWELCRKFQDHSDISFTDCTSFAVMKELRLRKVLTGDRHFDVVGMGFERVTGR